MVDMHWGGVRCRSMRYYEDPLSECLDNSNGKVLSKSMLVLH